MNFAIKIKRIAILVFFLRAAGSTCSQVDQASEMPSGSATFYDIFLIAGQSNTCFGVGYDSILDASDNDIFMVGRDNELDNKIILASEPLHHWQQKKNNIGFALTFAKLYKKKNLQKGRKVLLVPCGYGGSSIEEWAKGKKLYNDAVARTLKALRDNPGSTIKGILWHQGEANIGTPNYTNLLDTFITDIRNDLGNSDIPIVLGGMVPYWVNALDLRIIHQNYIKETPSRVSKAAYADPTVPSVISRIDNDTDDIHYHAKGQRRLGKRYYKAFMTIQ